MQRIGFLILADEMLRRSDAKGIEVSFWDEKDGTRYIAGIRKTSVMPKGGNSIEDHKEHFCGVENDKMDENNPV